jgi:hypothetical protein
MEYKSLFVLGRQPAIGRAELESLFGSDHLAPLGDFAVASDRPALDIPFARIGGSIRLARPLATLKNDKWPDIARAAIKQLPALLEKLPAEGKLKLGFSVYGLDISPQELLRTGLEAKKACKKLDRSVRVVPNTEATLNTAQVLHNSLTGELGVELLFLKDGEAVHLAQTVVIQDIDAYARRDRERPKRDAFIGMLPPKLAQTIVNLAVANADPHDGGVLLDPFCGTGVILQEATLMGFDVYGTDLNPRMVDYTSQNLMWLLDQPGTPIQRPPETPADPDWRYFRAEAGDATSYQWAPPLKFIATETYLGQPLNSWPSPDKLQEIMGACNVITQKFLANAAAQLPSGSRLCVAVPAWVGPNGRIHHLRMLDQLEVLGYNRVSFVWANEQEMVYYRPDQLVARELVVITRK